MVNIKDWERTKKEVDKYLKKGVVIFKAEKLKKHTKPPLEWSEAKPPKP